jgi:hypothetical protein
MGMTTDHSHDDHHDHDDGRQPGVVMKLTSATAPGVIETYTTFDDIADGVVDARVLGGIHWRTSCLRGRRVGQKVGAFAVRHFLKPKSEDFDDK